MEFVNKSPVKAGWTMGFDRDGRELLIVAVKATFAIPDYPNQPPALANEQAALTEADVFTGEPGFSSTLYETDYAHRKPKCDVLLNGSAYAPKYQKVERVTVSLQVGSMIKSFDVVGNRRWQAGMLATTASRIEPFSQMPISYDNAFGGADRSREDPLTFRYYPTNHAGKGFHEYTDAKFVDGKPLPNTEETGHLVTSPRGKYKPMAFGAIGRAWQQRARYAGTYNQKWIEEQAPFWPDDFDYRYFQSAPEDQQIPYPQGDEEVVLKNLTPDGICRFRLPKMRMPVVLIPVEGQERQADNAIDTLLIEPDKKRFMLTWRANVPMKRSVFDIVQTIVGEELDRVRRARQIPFKKRFKNLAELVHASKPQSVRVH
jgi:hypothetical protein